MPKTYDCIAHTTLTSNTSEVNFSSIPQTYTDLELVYQIFDTGAYPYFWINNYSATNAYPAIRLGISGNSLIGECVTDPELYINRNGGADTTYPFTGSIRFFNYTSNTIKNMLVMNGGIKNTPTNETEAMYVGWALNTSAITSIVCKNTSQYATNTTFSLYGILKA